MSNTSKETVWIKNPHGVVVALPPHLAAERLKQAGYSITEAEDVPKYKRYPVEGELTELGEKRRMHRAIRQVMPADSDAETGATPPTDISNLQPGAFLSPSDYRKLPWIELKKYAQMRGLNTMEPGMTKQHVLDLLDVMVGAPAMAA